MELDIFLYQSVEESLDRKDYAYNDVWNPNYDPDKTRINTTGIELDLDPSNQQSTQIKPSVAPIAPEEKTQITPRFFNQETGRLILSDMKIKELTRDVYQEMSGKIDPYSVREYAKRAKQLLGGIHLTKEEVENYVRPVSPTLADLYDEFVELKTNDEDILDFGHAITDILDNVIKAAA